MNGWFWKAVLLRQEMFCHHEMGLLYFLMVTTSENQDKHGLSPANPGPTLSSVK